MKIEQFELELQEISKDFKILKSQKGTGFATVFLFGEPLFGIPINDIYDEVKPGYGVDLPTGTFARYRSRPEALAQAKGTWERMKTDKDYADAVMGTGEYSKAKLDA